MKNTKLNTNIKWLITIIIAVGIGSLVLDVLDRTDMNIWIARVKVCTSSVFITLLINYLWLNNKSKH